MFRQTEKVNSVPFSPEVEEDRMIFDAAFFSERILSLSSVSSVLIIYIHIGLSDDDVRHFYETMR